MNKMTESQILSTILTKLEGLVTTGEALWYSRLNSGKIRAGMGWIQLCNAGTPDLIAIINRIDNSISVLFIECKCTGKTRLRYEQQQFFNRMKDNPRISCVLINDPKQLGPAIRKARGI